MIAKMTTPSRRARGRADAQQGVEVRSEGALSGLLDTLPEFAVRLDDLGREGLVKIVEEPDQDGEGGGEQCLLGAVSLQGAEQAFLRGLGSHDAEPVQRALEPLELIFGHRRTRWEHLPEPASPAHRPG